MKQNNSFAFLPFIVGGAINMITSIIATDLYNKYGSKLSIFIVIIGLFVSIIIYFLLSNYKENTKKYLLKNLLYQ